MFFSVPPLMIILSTTTFSSTLRPSTALIHLFKYYSFWQAVSNCNLSFHLATRNPIILDVIYAIEGAYIMAI